MELDQLEHEAVTAGACLALDQWERRLGMPAEPEPGLVALLDRHTARIRAAVGSVTPVNLAAYADGFADAVSAKGWSPSAVPDWRQASWPAVHLLAVCLIARSLFS
ncbi:DUF6401 family natural product biosynthesis protein [Actinoplanes siamensis]|uniref:Uncharacterized protein n=1 Tax=Actinoplanes siamensis TaxID=1223317 RepID=A0A919TIL0_9ACTN|nr:DUF6401 family natural product biosynthesis protein [Actinoplanes siamensis]GIF03834.1 hypothetical protein Asi03nite_13720 [Actinoplanes siamensis]